MDDLHRWGGGEELRYDAVDATSYACANLSALAAMARQLGNSQDADYFSAYRKKSAAALNSILWQGQTKSWRDRHPRTHQLAPALTITTFYPFFAGAGMAGQMDVFREHLLNPQQFWLPYPVPALAKDQPGFDANGFWQGPSWPAATCHVVEGFASAAKEFDRTLVPQAAELFRRAAGVHLQPRADFYERHNPIDGAPLSSFRDYMHSWWIDLIIRHAAGVMIREDGRVAIDPLPLGLEHFELVGAPFGKGKLDVLWRNPDRAGGGEPGLLVRLNGRTIVSQRDFKPGDPAVPLPR